jgi:D-3-phosphoglycerate dehydrogenase
MSNKVLIAAPVHAVLTDGLAAAGYECVVREKITQELAYTLLGDCVGVITSTRLMLDKNLLDAAPLLKWIGRMGSGMEVIDVPYAIAKGIACYSSPEGNCNAVAEHTLGMLLGLNKKILVSAGEVRAGQWLREQNRGTELEGKTIGIIGFGHTGRAFARKLQAFDMQILAYDADSTLQMPAYVQKCTNLDMLYTADIVSFHVPLTKTTFHYLNDVFVTNMKKPFILINTSRGDVVDTKSLLAALESGKISGACLDVLEEEPLDKMSAYMKEATARLASMQNVVLTPHIAGYSHEALYKMSKILMEKISHGFVKDIE